MTLRQRRNQPGGPVESHRRHLGAERHAVPLLSNRYGRDVAAAIFLGLAAFSLNGTPTVDRNSKSTAFVGTRQNMTDNRANNGTENGEGADRSGSEGERGGGPPPFQWDYLGEKIACGSDKCLYRSSSSVNDTAGVAASDRDREDPHCGVEGGYQTGYLVGKDNENGENNEESFIDGWEITQYLAGRFGIQHLFLGPAVRVPGSRPNAAPRVVQKVRIAPATMWEMKYYAGPYYVTKSLDRLLDSLVEKSETPETDNDRILRAVAAAEGCGFFERLDDQLARTIDMLSCEPLMALDFQAIVDASGNIYHLDFDRVVNNNGGYGYDQAAFNIRLKRSIRNAVRVLDLAQKWTRGKQLIARKANENTNRNSTAVAIPERVVPPAVPSEASCNGDWEAEEARILASNELPCLATERVAIARHWRSATESEEKNTTVSTAAISKAGEKGGRPRHPLLVAMLQRVIKAGFYQNEDNEHSDCNVFGDRVVS